MNAKEEVGSGRMKIWFGMVLTFDAATVLVPVNHDEKKEEEEGGG